MPKSAISRLLAARKSCQSRYPPWRGGINSRKPCGSSAVAHDGDLSSRQTSRSTTDLLRIVDDLDRRGVGLIMLSTGGQRIDTRAATGKLMITMLGSILRRTGIGIASVYRVLADAKKAAGNRKVAA